MQGKQTALEEIRRALEAQNRELEAAYAVMRDRRSTRISVHTLARLRDLCSVRSRRVGAARRGGTIRC